MLAKIALCSIIFVIKIFSEAFMFKNGYVLLDGAMGTNLYKRGMPGGICVEEWNIDHPDVFCDIQNMYIDAGSDVIYAPTFGANRVSLSAYGLGDRVYDFNRKLIELTVKNACGRCTVAASVTTTGLFTKPFGDTDINELIDVYVEQIAAIKDGGASFVVGETLMSAGDIRAFAFAAKQCGMPFAVTVTVDRSGRTLSGMSASAAIVIAQSLGAFAAGINCSEGPDVVYNALLEAMPFAYIPVIAKPNGGLPESPLSVDEFADGCQKLLNLGVTAIGGCCGTDGEHILRLRHMLNARKDMFKLPSPSFKGLADWQNAYAMPDEPIFSDVCVCNTADDIFSCDFSNCDIAVIELHDVEAAKAVSPELFALSKPVAFRCDDGLTLAAALQNYDGRAGIIDSDGNLSLA